jgi:hypothetical protein
MDAADLAAQGEPRALSDEVLLKNLLARRLTNRMEGKEAAPHARRGHLLHRILRHEEVQGSYPGLERPRLVDMSFPPLASSRPQVYTSFVRDGNNEVIQESG